MYLDLTTTKESVFEADVCIIGSGAAGFACALSLLHSGRRVLVVESGMSVLHEQITDLHQGEVSNHPHTGIHEGRVRIIGGTTTKWGGQALPFLEEDFHARSHVPGGGWPITKAELAPYYQKAEAILGTDASQPFGYRPWKDWRVQEPSFSPNTIDLLVTKWCKIPNFAHQHGDKIKDSTTVSLLSNASVVEVLPNETGTQVQSLRICSIEGRVGSIQASYVIVASGAIETVRLFLNSPQFGKRGLGNDAGLVGKYFQDHVTAVVGEVLPKSRKRMHEVFDPFYKNGFKYLPRLLFAPALAEKRQVLHASAQLMFADDEKSALNTAKRLFSDIRKKQFSGPRELKALVNPAFVVEAVKALLRWKVSKRGSAGGAGPIWLEVHSEQAPTADSYISLSHETDALNVPRVKLNWTISDLTISTIRAVAELLKKEFEQTGLGTVVLAPWILNPAQHPRRWLADTFHQAGGLRMAADATQGVVDARCKVFGVDNLYVASSAVFPTSSFSNPTMTTIALAIRITEEVVRHLDAKLVLRQVN